jgi:hypothetical protein
MRSAIVPQPELTSAHTAISSMKLSRMAGRLARVTAQQLASLLPRLARELVPPRAA